MTAFWSFITKRRRPARDAHGFAGYVVDAEEWRALATALNGENATLLGLWGDGESIRLAALDAVTNAIAVFSLACPEGRYPSVGRVHAPAQRPERAVRDLTGLVADGAPDSRAWLDHGRWGLRHPLGSARSAAPKAKPYAFLAAEGEGLHEIPVGPVHAGIIEPGHFRFTANGETIVRLEERLGFVHKGTNKLIEGAPLDVAARLAARISGDSSIAYSFAFARAAEAALGIDPPDRAIWLCALMAELERLANHLGDIGAVCNDAAFALMPAHCAVLREQVLRAAAKAFGHRLMFDRIVPGGVATDLSAEGAAAISAMTDHVRKRFPAIVELYDDTPSLQDRTVKTGFLSAELAAAFGAGGFVGRASGRLFDARKALAYAPYDDLAFDVPVRVDGDVNARVWIRIGEVEQSLDLVDRILARLPEGPILCAPTAPYAKAEGLALVEGFRGDVLVWLRIGTDGLVERCHLRDPSWFQWPLLEAVVENNIVADFPLCNKSFNCSYSGHDL
ncbi:MAG: NADH-quinone oxidoreductase subunit C [Alphaproteobacteria bacterium]|nr:NADH-quinone oxidoreductase subunit C [Alphaproteobacteria bacterium]